MVVAPAAGAVFGEDTARLEECEAFGFCVGELGGVGPGAVDEFEVGFGG
jgi:hypothetical protein